MRLSRAIVWLARWLALLGGAVLIAVTVLTCVSIIGRSLVFMGLGPVNGDFELVQAGVGFAVFAFLPWCQLNRGHARVDVFTSFLPDGVKRFIDALAETVMSIVVVLIAWRLWYGMMDKFRYGETSYILQFPVWWPFAACMAAAAIAVVVSIFVTILRIRELATGRTIDPVARERMQ